MFGLLFLLPSTSFAKMETIYATHKYIMGDNDSKIEARRICFSEAKRSVLDKAGAYIESYTEVKDARLTKDEISAYSARLLKVVIVQETWRPVRENLEVRLKVKAQVDTDSIKKSFVELANNSSLRKKLKQQQKHLKELEIKFSKLQKQMFKDDNKPDIEGFPSLEFEQSGLLEPWVTLYKNRHKLGLLSFEIGMMGSIFDGKSLRELPKEFVDIVELLDNLTNVIYDSHDSVVPLIIITPLVKGKYKGLFARTTKETLKTKAALMETMHEHILYVCREQNYVKVSSLAKKVLKILKSSSISFEQCIQIFDRMETSVKNPKLSKTNQ